MQYAEICKTRYAKIYIVEIFEYMHSISDVCTVRRNMSIFKNAQICQKRMNMQIMC